MIVAEGTQAHDFHVTVRLHRQARSHAEGYLDSRSNPGIEAEFFHTAHLRPAGVTNRRARLQPTGKREVNAVRRSRAAERAAEREIAAHAPACWPAFPR